MLADHAGVKWCPARVQERDGGVLLVASCSTHGDLSTLLCANAAFFQRSVSRQLLGGPGVPGAPGYLGYHAISSRARARAAVVTAGGHAITDVPLFGSNGCFVPDEEIADSCRAATAAQSMVRLQCKLAPDLDKINAKILLAEKAADSVIIVEASHDRLIALCHFPGSALLRRRVVPAVKYYLEPGDEMRCYQELVATIAELTRISDIQLLITIVVELPFPDLTEILRMLRRHHEMVRVITLTVARPQAAIMTAVKHFSHVVTRRIITTVNNNGIGADGTDAGPPPSVDLYRLLEAVQVATDGEVLPSDFSTPGVCGILGTLLRKVGVSNLVLNPCPAMGAVAFLLNTEQMSSVPATRVVNIDQIIDDLTPLLAKGAPSSLTLAAGLKKALQRAFLPGLGAKIPSLIGLALDSSEFVRSIGSLMSTSQVLVVRREVDLAALDVEQLLAPIEVTTLTSKLLEAL